MRKFAFTLQSMLNLKESQEKQMRNTLGALARRLNELTAERDELLGRRGRASGEYGERLASGMMAAETQWYTDYFRMMKETLDGQECRIAAAAGELEECRAKLVEAMREIRTLENLRGKQYEQYQQEIQQEQEKTIGDFVSFQSTHKPGKAQQAPQERTP